MATPVEAHAAPSPSGSFPPPVHNHNSQREEKSGTGGDTLKMPSSQDGEDAPRGTSSDDHELPSKVQVHDEPPSKLPPTHQAWPMENIANPGVHDCLMGRGGGTNHHPGNKRYRAITEAKKLKYLASKRLDKPLVAMEVINEWRSLNPMGRFLKQNPETKLWYDVGDKKAREKTSQALREKISYLMVEGADNAHAPGKTAARAADGGPYKKGVWTEEEMQRVREARKEFGNRWSEVARRVPGRSEMSVKNWWYNHQTSEKRKRKRQSGEAARRNLVASYNRACATNHSTSYAGEEDTRQRALNGGSLGNGYKIVNSSASEDGYEFGAVGHSFRRQLEDKNGNDLGWYVGTVVDVLCGTDKNRRCLYYAIGFIEDLSISDLKELALLEESQHAM